MVRGGKEGRVYGPLLVNPYLIDVVKILNMERNEHPCVSSLERAL